MRRCRQTRIYVYTHGMKIVKVRRVGNSNVLSIPREFESSGYAPGSTVLVEGMADGELRLLPTARVRERIQDVAVRLVSERAEALEVLANHDQDADSPT